MKGWGVGVEATGGGSCGGPGRKSNVFEGGCQILIHASLGFLVLSLLFTLCSKLIKSVRMMARVVRVLAAWVTAYASIVKLEVETVRSVIPQNKTSHSWSSQGTQEGSCVECPHQ